MIKQERIVVEMPLRRRAVSIITVSEVIGKYDFGGGSMEALCLKKPLGVVLKIGREEKAFSINGKEMEMADFVKKFPDSKTLLERRPTTRRKQQ